MTVSDSPLAKRFESVFGRSPEWFARAPGRVDLMGSHTDYNGGWVMTMPLDLELQLVAAPRADDRIRLFSLDLGSDASWGFDTQPTDAEEFLRYPAGVISLLRGMGRRVTGFDALVTSTIPVGGGLSSSAAFEAATAVLQRALGGWDADARDLALLCQKAENEVVGVPCGVLDQFSSLLGVEGCVLLLDCRTLETRPIHMPSGLAAAICDTRVPRKLAGSEYATRRRDCEAAAAFFTHKRGERVQLRDVSFEDFECEAAYFDERVARRSRFIVRENQRVLDLADAFSACDHQAIGTLCRDSFEEDRDGFEITIPAMEHLHAAMTQAPGCVGARQAGAGFGGCMVAIVEESKAYAFEQAVQKAYTAAVGHEAGIRFVHPAAGASAARID